MLCQFLLYNKVSQLYVYIYLHISSLLHLPPTLPIPPLQVDTKHRADLPVLFGCFPLAIYFTFGGVYMSCITQILICVFSFNLKPFLISLLISSLIHGLFSRVLFNFQIFGDFPDIILLLISSLIPLWSEISILLHLSKFVLWPRIFSILINVPCAHEKNIYSAILCKVSNKCKYGWLIVLFSSSILLLILLSICSITEKEILKSAI